MELDICGKENAYILSFKNLISLLSIIVRNLIKVVASNPQIKII